MNISCFKLDPMMPVPADVPKLVSKVLDNLDLMRTSWGRALTSTPFDPPICHAEDTFPRAARTMAAWMCSGRPTAARASLQRTART